MKPGSMKLAIKSKLGIGKDTVAKVAPNNTASSEPCPRCDIKGSRGPSYRVRDGKRRSGMWKVGMGLVFYAGIVCVFNVSLVDNSTPQQASGFSGRKLLSDKFNCTPRAVEEFPPDFFTDEEKINGGIFVHFLIVFYLCAALAVLCDDYFVSSLEVICEQLNLKPDVAGATFMAAGSSAPELATAVIGVFIAKSDVGVGTIVGSAVFNILCIVAMCGLFAGAVIELSWWPLVRDTFCYMLSVVAFIVVIQDEQVYWYEGVIFMAMYIAYITIMYFNTRLEKYFTSRIRMFGKDYSSLPQDAIESTGLLESGDKETVEKETTFSDNLYRSRALTLSQASVAVISDGDEVPSPWTVPESFVGRCFYVGLAPVKLLMFLTIPDCRRTGIWRKLFMLTFLMSVVWISLFSYVLVWMVTIIGDSLGIPDTVMGLTFLAAGTSVPDALGGLLVARDGLGDMAVSNAVGSNIFDILVCLGLPWLLRTVIYSSTEAIVPINSSGLKLSAVILLSTVFILFFVVALNRWRMDKKLGVIFLVIYAVVITFTCLFELNVFGDFNPPSCSK